MSLIAHFGNLVKDKRYTGMLVVLILYIQIYLFAIHFHSCLRGVYCSEYWFTSVGTTPCIYLSIEERVSRFWQEKVTDCRSYSLWSWHNTLKYFAWHVSLLFVRAQGIYCKAAMIVVYRTSLHDSGHAVIVQGFLSSCGCCRSSCIHITNSCKELLWHLFLLHHLSQLSR